MLALSKEDQTRVWETIVRAVGAEPREHLSIRGASGIDHVLKALAVDDRTNRLVLISAEPTARMGLLVGRDIQEAMPDTQVLIARPITIDLPALVKKVFRSAEEARIDWGEVKKSILEIQKADNLDKKASLLKSLPGWVHGMNPAFVALQNDGHSGFRQIADFISELGTLDWADITKGKESDPENSIFSLSSLFNTDSMEADRRYGVCPVPLFEFTEFDWEMFANGRDIDAARDRLKQLDILQYFFPPPDKLALGLVERGIKEEDQTLSAVQSAPELGHLLGDNELVPRDTPLIDLIDAMKERKYLLEGEETIEVTEIGKTVRTTVRIRPAEGLISKVLSRLNVNFSASPKDFMRP